MIVNFSKNWSCQLIYQWLEYQRQNVNYKKRLPNRRGHYWDTKGLKRQRPPPRLNILYFERDGEGVLIEVFPGAYGHLKAYRRFTKMGLYLLVGFWLVSPFKQGKAIVSSVFIRTFITSNSNLSEINWGWHSGRGVSLNLIFILE